MALTQAKIDKFVKTRNKAEFSSNLQFEIDLNACGLKVVDLGEVTKKTTARGMDYYYRWPLPGLSTVLVETSRGATLTVNRDCSIEHEEDEVHRASRY